MIWGFSIWIIKTRPPKESNMGGLIFTTVEIKDKNSQNPCHNKSGYGMYYCVVFVLFAFAPIVALVSCLWWFLSTTSVWWQTCDISIMEIWGFLALRLLEIPIHCVCLMADLWQTHNGDLRLLGITTFGDSYPLRLPDGRLVTNTQWRFEASWHYDFWIFLSTASAWWQTCDKHTMDIWGFLALRLLDIPIHYVCLMADLWQTHNGYSRLTAYAYMDDDLDSGSFPLLVTNSGGFGCPPPPRPHSRPSPPAAYYLVIVETLNKQNLISRRRLFL
jgi:hypothetical protein